MKMLKGCAVAILTLWAASAGFSQEQAPLYTRVAHWQIERQHWDAYEKGQTKFTPVFDKLLADGVIDEYGFDASSVHTADGSTHSSWFSSKTLAGLEKALEALQATLQKMTPEERKKQDTDFSGEKHTDHIMRSVFYRTRSAKLDKGYDGVSTAVVKPGQGREYRELWDKYTKPVYEQLFNDGTVTAYGLDVEHVHTTSPGLRITWWIVPNAEALDKMEAAFEAARSKATEVERQAIGRMFADTTEPGTHRDSMYRIIRYASK